MRVMRKILLLMLVLALNWAWAQVAFDQANSLRLARFSEQIGIRMLALTYQPSEKLAQSMLEDDLPLLAGSLEGINPRLLQKIRATLEEVQTLVEQKRGLHRVSQKLRGLIAQTQQTLIPPQIRSDPAFEAALILQLLTHEEGVGDQYEASTAGEEGAYTLAWAGLQRVKVLWRSLKKQWAAQPDAVRQNDVALAQLEKLLPSPVATARLGIAEDAEKAVTDASFALEQGAGKPLDLQDLSKSWDLVYRFSNQSCRATQASQQSLALEWIMAAHLYYLQHLNNPLQTLEPPLQKELSTLLETSLPDHIARGYGVEGECAKLFSLLAKARSILR